MEHTCSAFVELDCFGKAVFFFCEVEKHELKMRLEFCYHIVVLALNNKKLDLFKFLQMPLTSHPAASCNSTTYLYATLMLLSAPTPEQA